MSTGGLDIEQGSCDRCFKATSVVTVFMIPGYDGYNENEYYDICRECLEEVLAVFTEHDRT